jgi:hypothetical protein
MNKIYIDLPYNLLQQGKSLGAIFDVEKKSFYILDDAISPQFELILVDVPFGFSDIAKDTGAKYFKDIKQWKTCRFNLERFKSIMNNDDIKKLKLRELELKNNPTFKIISNIEKLNSMYEKYKIN